MPTWPTQTSPTTFNSAPTVSFANTATFQTLCSIPFRRFPLFVLGGRAWIGNSVAPMPQGVRRGDSRCSSTRVITPLLTELTREGPVHRLPGRMSNTPDDRHQEPLLPITLEKTPTATSACLDASPDRAPTALVPPASIHPRTSPNSLHAQLLRQQSVPPLGVRWWPQTAKHEKGTW